MSENFVVIAGYQVEVKTQYLVCGKTFETVEAAREYLTRGRGYELLHKEFIRAFNYSGYDQCIAERTLKYLEDMGLLDMNNVIVKFKHYFESEENNET